MHLITMLIPVKKVASTLDYFRNKKGATKTEYDRSGVSFTLHEVLYLERMFIFIKITQKRILERYLEVG